MDYSISIYLDTRRAKADSLYPVKLRIYSPVLKSTKYYPTKFNLCKKDFAAIWETTKPRQENKEYRRQLAALENEANHIAAGLSPFSFEQFEKKLFRNSGEGENVIYHYNRIIERLKGFNRYGTANNYETSLKSLTQFIEQKKGKAPSKILFAEITPHFLHQYEAYMVEVKKRSRTTVSMYLRALKTVYNTAIAEKEIHPDLYPFGKNKYQVPGSRNVKKALSKSDLKTLFEAVPKTADQEKAKDFWFFSYACNGINIKDIALLKYENLKGDKLILYRAKTINTSKADLKPISIFLNDYALSIIKKYGNKHKKAGQYIFPVVSDERTEFENFRAIKNFITYINQHLRKLANTVGVTEELSTYWARHSFATNAIRKGATMEFISEALNHSNLRTTQSYFSGFEDKTKKEFTEGMMDFN